MKTIDIETDCRFGSLTVKQYLGLDKGMSLRVAGRMITLSGDMISEIIGLCEDSFDPRLGRDDLSKLARQATKREVKIHELMVLAAQNCTTDELGEVPHAIRANAKIAANLRSIVCSTAIVAEVAYQGQQAS